MESMEDQKATYFRNRGNHYYNIQDFDKALHCYKMGLSFDNLDPLLYSNMSLTHLALKSYNEAEEDARRAIELDKDNAKAYFRAAKAADGLGDQTKAITYLCSGLKVPSLAQNSELKNYLDELSGKNRPMGEKSMSSTHVDNGPSTPTTPSKSKVKVSPSESKPSEPKASNKTKESMVNDISKGRGKTGPIESKDIADDKFLQTVEAAMPLPAPTQQIKRRMILEFVATSKDGSELLLKGLLKTAATKYKCALDILVEYPPQCLDLGRMEEVLLKYSISWCWIQSKDIQYIAKAIEYLNAIRDKHSAQLPAVYYALGNAYFKINRFPHASKNLEKGLNIIKKKHQFDSYPWPGTETTIKETTSDGLQESILDLLPACKQFHPPDAICKHSKETCFALSNQTLPSEFIYLSDPDYVGFVIIICQMKCKIQYHLACWKDLKENESLVTGGKVSDKDMLGWPCPTDDCFTSTGRPSVVVAIQIIGENGVMKSQCEREPVKEKVDPPSDAKKLKKKTEKVKSTTTASTTTEKEKPKLKPRPLAAEKKAPVPAKAPYPSKPVTSRYQGNNMEYPDDDEFHVEDESPTDSEEYLIQKTHAKHLEDFACYDQAIGQPMEAYFGRDDWDQDLWFVTKSANSCQDFIFSFFHDFLKEDGPQPVTEIEDRWEDEKKDCGQYRDLASREDFPGIINYLSESFHFIIVNDYIGTAAQASEVYELATSDITDCFEFLLKDKDYPPLNVAPDIENNIENPKPITSKVTNVNVEPKVPENIISRFPTKSKTVEDNSSKVAPSYVVGGMKTEISSPKKVKGSGKQPQKCDENEKKVDESKKSGDTVSVVGASDLEASNVNAEDKPRSEKNKKSSKSLNLEVTPSLENKKSSKGSKREVVPSLVKRSLNQEIAPSSATIEPSSAYQAAGGDALSQKHPSKTISKQTDEILTKLKPVDLIQHSKTSNHSKKTSIETSLLDQELTETHFDKRNGTNSSSSSKSISFPHEEHNPIEDALLRIESVGSVEMKAAAYEKLEKIIDFVGETFDKFMLSENGISSNNSKPSNSLYTIAKDSLVTDHLQALPAKTSKTVDESAKPDVEANGPATEKYVGLKESVMSETKWSVKASEFQPKKSVSSDQVNPPTPTIITNPFWEDKTILNCPVMFQDSLLDAEVPNITSIKKEIVNGMIIGTESIPAIFASQVKLEPTESPQTSCKPEGEQEDEFDEVISRGADILSQTKGLNEGELQPEASHIAPTVPALKTKILFDSKICQTELRNNDIEELIHEWEESSKLRNSIASKPKVECADVNCQTDVTTDALDRMAFKLEGATEENKALALRMKSADEVTLILLEVRKKVEAENHQLREEHKKVEAQKEDLKREVDKALEVNHDLVDMNNRLRDEKNDAEQQISEAKQVAGQLQQKIEFFKDKEFDNTQEILSIKTLYLKLVTEFAEVKISECDDKYRMMLLKLQDAKNAPNLEAEKIGQLTELQSQLRKDHKKASEFNNEVMSKYEALKQNLERANFEHLPMVKIAEISNEYHMAICDIELPEKQDAKPCCSHRCGEESESSSEAETVVKAPQNVVHVPLPPPPHFIPEEGVKYVFHRLSLKEQNTQPNFSLPNGVETMTRSQQRPSSPFTVHPPRPNMYMQNVYHQHNYPHNFPNQMPQFRQPPPLLQGPFNAMHHPQIRHMQMGMGNMPSRHQINIAPPHNAYSGQPVYSSYRSSVDIKNPNLINEIFGEKDTSVHSGVNPQAKTEVTSQDERSNTTNSQEAQYRDRSRSNSSKTEVTPRDERSNTTNSQDAQYGDRSRSNSFSSMPSGSSDKPTERLQKSNHSLPKLQNVVPIDRDTKDLTRLVEELKKRHPLHSMAELQKCIEVVRDRDENLSRMPFSKINSLITAELDARAKSRTNAWGSLKPDVNTWKPEKMEEDCSICMDKMDKMRTHTLDCQHTFHFHCIKQWLGRNSICPMCNRHTKLSDEYPPLK